MDLSSLFAESEKPDGAEDIERRVLLLKERMQGFNDLKLSYDDDSPFRFVFPGSRDTKAQDVFLDNYPYDYRLFQAVIGDIEFPYPDDSYHEHFLHGPYFDDEKDTLVNRTLGQCEGFDGQGFGSYLAYMLSEWGEKEEGETIASWAGRLGKEHLIFICEGPRHWVAIGFDPTTNPYTPVDLANEYFLGGPKGTDFLSYIEWEVEVVIDTCMAVAIEGYGRYPGGDGIEPY